MMKNLGVKQYSSNQIIDFLRSKKESFWLRQGEEMVWALFRETAKRVPAYREFLKKNGIAPERIRSFHDFQAVPPMDKVNYLRRHSLEKLCWDSTFRDKSLVFTCTSGSTGTPFYFPRDEVLDLQSTVAHEVFLRQLTGGARCSTLVIDSFGMGVWIGGLITYQAFRNLALKGYPVTIITPGTNKKEIFDALKHIGGKFDRVVLCGYPPFLKDVIDEGKREGISWKRLNVKLLFAAEAFGESFRDYVAKKIGVKNLYTDIANIYGTADLGTMAQETPLCVLIRRLALKNKTVFEKIFPGVNKMPTLAQFNPMFVQFEAPAGKILCTGYNALPLIRYSIGDHGGVVPFGGMRALLREAGVDILGEAKKLGIAHTIAELPFVHVYERADFSTKLYGAIIYPEHIREVMFHKSLENFLTGKFAVATKHDKHHNEYLEVNCEMKKGVRGSKILREVVAKLVVRDLLKKNSEYQYLFGAAPQRVLPHVVLWEYGHPSYFKGGVKQKWVLV